MYNVFTVYVSIIIPSAASSGARQRERLVNRFKEARVENVVGPLRHLTIPGYQQQ